MKRYSTMSTLSMTDDHQQHETIQTIHDEICRIDEDQVNETSTKESSSEKIMKNDARNNTHPHSKEEPVRYQHGILSSFLTQLLEERQQPQNSESSSNIAVVSDNAHAHACSLRLVRRQTSLDLLTQQHHRKQLALDERDKAVESNLVEDSCFQQEEKKDDDDESDHLTVIHRSPLLDGTGCAETREENTSNIRVLQRPCRWSSDDSLSSTTLPPLPPNSPPIKTDYVPRPPTRKSSKDMTAAEFFDSTPSSPTGEDTEIV